MQIFPITGIIARQILTAASGASGEHASTSPPPVTSLENLRATALELGTASHRHAARGPAASASSSARSWAEVAGASRALAELDEDRTERLERQAQPHPARLAERPKE